MNTFSDFECNIDFYSHLLIIEENLSQQSKNKRKFNCDHNCKYFDSVDHHARHMASYHKKYHQNITKKLDNNVSYNCSQCGILCNKSYGKNRFCGESCARSYSIKHRKFSK